MRPQRLESYVPNEDPGERPTGLRLPRRSSPRLLWIYLALGLALTIAYYTLPGSRVELWTPMVLLTVVAMVTGVRIHRPAHPAGWYLLAAATFCFILGDATYLVLTEVLDVENPYPSAADVFYLLTYPLFAGGLLLLIRRRARTRDWGGMLDATILTVGLGVVFWIFLVVPALDNEALSTMQRAATIAATLGDVLVLAVLVRLIIGGGLRMRAAQILAVGVVGLLASDFAYALSQVQLGWEVGGWTQLGWTAFYASWGAAALHPSMREITETARPRQRRSRPRSSRGLRRTRSAPAGCVVDRAHRAPGRGRRAGRMRVPAGARPTGRHRRGPSSVAGSRARAPRGR